MSEAGNLLSNVCSAQSRNSTLRGEELRQGAQTITGLALDRGLALLAADPTGERLIGAALSGNDRLTTCDRSRRLDGVAVLLVSGRVAGTAWLAREARIIRALGASRVEVALLDGPAEIVPDCDDVFTLPSPETRPATAFAAARPKDRRPVGSAA